MCYLTFGRIWTSGFKFRYCRFLTEASCMQLKHTGGTFITKYGKHSLTLKLGIYVTINVSKI